MPCIDELFDVLQRDGVLHPAALAHTLTLVGDGITEEGVLKHFTDADEKRGVDRERLVEVASTDDWSDAIDAVGKWIDAFGVFEGCDVGGERFMSLDDAQVLMQCLGADPAMADTPPTTSSETSDVPVLLFSDFLTYLRGVEPLVPVTQLPHLRTLYEQLGSDGSGFVSFGVITILLTCLGYHLTEDDVAKKAETLFPDHPGSFELCFPDFLRLVASCGHVNVGWLLDAHLIFKVFDKADTGAIARANIANVFRTLGQTPSSEQLEYMMRNVGLEDEAGVTFPMFIRLMSQQLALSLGTDGNKQRLRAQSLCGECQTQIATIDCTQCHESYCKECCAIVHSKGRRKRHSEFVYLKLCEECEVVAAKWECQDCMEVFCDECCRTVHSQGRRKGHNQIHELDGSLLKAVEYDASNGFGIHVVHDLSIVRFSRHGSVTMGLVPEDLPKYLQGFLRDVQDVTEICSTQNMQFIDSEYTYHEPDEEKTLPSIDIGITNDHVNAALREKMGKEMTRLADEHYEATREQLFMWRRPSQLFKASFLFMSGNTLLGDWPTYLPRPQWLIPNLVKFVPGVFRDEWLLLALAMVSLHKDLFKHLFLASDYAPYGLYAFQFYDFEEKHSWTPVMVDSYIPLQLQGTKVVPTFGRLEEESSLWLIYMLKGYAKFRGAYSYLHGGSVPTALKHLTGGMTHTERWNPKKIDVESTCLLWWKLEMGTRLGWLMACFRNDEERPVGSSGVEIVPDSETSTMRWAEGEQILLTVDVTPMMTMDLTGVRRDGGLKFIKLRNLYGKSTVPNNWDWNPESSKWSNKRIRKVLNYSRVDECIQWVDVRDFVQHYNTFVTLYNHSHIPYSNVKRLDPCPKGKTPCYAHQYMLRLSLPELGDLGLCEGALDGNEVNVEELYNPPDFRDMSESSDEEGDLELIERQSYHSNKKSAKMPATSPGHNAALAKGYTVKIFLSQPNLAILGENSCMRKPLNLRVFRLLGRDLQAVEQSQSDDDPDEYIYKWPTYNLVETEELQLNEPTSNPEKLRELSELESLQQFVVKQPGAYAVVVEQEDCNDSIDYCIAVTGKEQNVADQTGFTMECEFAGSSIDPLFFGEDVSEDRESSVVPASVMM